MCEGIMGIYIHRQKKYNHRAHHWLLYHVLILSLMMANKRITTSCFPLGGHIMSVPSRRMQQQQMMQQQQLKQLNQATRLQSLIQRLDAIHNRKQSTFMLRVNPVTTEHQNVDRGQKEGDADDADKGVVEMMDNGIHESPNDKKLQVWTARMLILLAACLYGTNFTCVKILGENLPLQVGIAMRFSVAAMATLPWLLLSSSSSSSSRTSDSDTNTFLSDNGRPQSEESWNEFKIPSEMLGPMVGGAEVGFWNTLGFLGQAMGLQTSLASTSAFICSLAVVTVPLYDFLAGKKIFSRSIIGAILAVMGVALLEVGDLLLEEGGGSVVGAGVQEDGFMPSTGTLYSLIQPIAFGMGFWRLEYWTRKYPGAEGGLKLTAAHMMTIASLMVCCVLIFHSNDVYHIQEWIRNPTVLGAILWTGIVTTAIPSFFETKALKSLTAAETTMLYSTEPIFGSIFAAAVLGESMGLGGGIGALMVVFGCLYSSLGPSGETQQTS